MVYHNRVTVLVPLYDLIKHNIEKINNNIKGKALEIQKEKITMDMELAQIE